MATAEAIEVAMAREGQPWWALSRDAQLTTAEVKAQRDAILDLQKQVMREGQDYGTIPGTQKPTLYKPGAEMICAMYKLTPEPEILTTVEDWDRPFFSYK